MKKLLMIIAIFALNSGAVFAGSSYSGKIKSIHSGPGIAPIVFLIMENDPNNRQSCQTNNTYHYAFDASGDAGKVVFSMALSAYASGKSVYLGGTSECTVYPGMEDLKWLRLQ